MVEDTATRLMKVPCAGGLGFLHRVGERLDVLHSFSAENDAFANASLHDARLLDPELDRAALGALTAPVTSIVTVPTSGSASCRAARAPCRAGRPAHQVGRGDAAVEIDRSALHLLTRSSGDHIGTGRPRLIGLARAANTPTRTLRPVPFGNRPRQHHLIGVTRIDAEIHRDLDGLVETSLGAVLDLFTASSIV